MLVPPFRSILFAVVSGRVSCVVSIVVVFSALMSGVLPAYLASLRICECSLLTSLFVFSMMFCSSIFANSSPGTEPGSSRWRKIDSPLDHRRKSLGETQLSM